MSSYIFNPTKKSFKTSFSSYIKYGFVVPLKNLHVWIFYADGHWVFFDSVGNKIIQQGKVEGDTSKLVDLIKSPQPIDDSHIVFVNCTTFKLQCLDPYTGKYDDTWTGDAPTVETLPQADRTNENKITDAFNDLAIEVLKKSKLVGMIERREFNQGYADFLLTVYKQNSKERVAQIIHNAQQKQIRFNKGNEEDTFILWTPYQTGSFTFSVFNVNKADQGLQTVTITQNLTTSLIYCAPWAQDSIAFFGNADGSGIPEQYIYTFGKDEIKTLQMSYYPEGKDTLLTEVVAVDGDKKRVLLNECADALNIVLYNAATNKADFLKQQSEDGVFAVSNDGRYFVEYDGLMCGDSSDQPGETTFTINSFLNKKMFILHFMRNAKAKNGQTYLELYGNPYIAKHVAEMLSA